MSGEEATSLLNRQEKLVKTAKKLQPSLKPKWSGGNWIDQKSGKLVVAVTDKRHAAEVDAEGTETRLVKYSEEELSAAKSSVDKLAKRFSPSGVTWYTDVRANVVTVKVAKSTMHKGKTQEFIDAVRALGPVVKIRSTDKPVATNSGMDNGHKIEGTNDRSCSIGWWVKDKSGADLIMTAGHCTEGDHALWRYNGLHFGGTTNTNSEPMDWGTIHVDDIAAPRPTTGVTLYHDDKKAKISGFGKAPVGTEICKSGYKSKQTCGPILAHDISVTYTDGAVRTGMSSAALHSDSGDSGGSVYQMDPEKKDTHVIAQGVLSGSGGSGKDETMYYQPIESALLDGDLIFVKSTS
ncbi:MULTISPECIES: S1 family peptidase [unclassified Streptomyces]|uniref:S1 family peptidase n=1 Tax=unclassified Streptomyces TaxID=2593676 RepID=UPI002DDB8B21|nr:MULTISPECIES: S1 family peptidase [unclassified Streptomyces]WSA96589.1 S1 family peptidase [Streptomyces sp. NBC_01795]WSB81004.1 S1 family peptidase [Streptomyces sp. NBC_01775]WSS10785.1 S1 family peptidase [Streptomyces sp. NBC_01186]WSS39485.1 S1 family peptidase [Streptomyces sp. NBC_01187]